MKQSRRDFLKTSAALGAALGSRFAFGEAAVGPQRDVLVVVFARGAMDGLSLVVPYGDSNYYRLRPNLAIAKPRSGSGAAIDLDGYFGLHPALAPLHPFFERKQLAIVHATGAPSHNRSHFAAQDMMERGEFAANASGAGWLNRHLANVRSGSLFEGVGFGGAVQRSLSGDVPVVGMNQFADFKLATGSKRAAELNRQLRALYPFEHVLDASARNAFDAVERMAADSPAKNVAQNGADYPTTPFGQQLLEVAQMIKADIGLQVATVDIGGWDHHFNELKRLQPLAEQYAKALAAFATDLGDRMKGVTIVTMSEFGRRAHENASGGTDHGMGNCLFVLGGGVNGGKVYADWPGLDDSHLQGGDLAVTTDYRTVLSELLRKRRGDHSLDRVFPGFPKNSQSGIFRPLA